MNTMSCEKHLGMGTVQNCAPCLQVELDYVRSEIEALRADVVWLLAHKMIGYGDRISYAKEPRSWSLRKELDHDGTPDDILRAVREARTKWARMFWKDSP